MCEGGIKTNLRHQEIYRAGTTPPGFEIPGSAGGHVYDLCYYHTHAREHAYIVTSRTAIKLFVLELRIVKLSELESNPFVFVYVQ